MYPSVAAGVRGIGRASTSRGGHRERAQGRALARRHGLRVEEALELVRNRAYDLALCDVNLSGEAAGQSGRETALQIVAASHRGAKPEVVFMTGDLVEENGGSGPFHQLQKPFRVSDVLTVLREALSLKPAEKLPR